MDALSSTLDRRTGAVRESTGKPPLPPKPDGLKKTGAPIAPPVPRSSYLHGPGASTMRPSTLPPFRPTDTTPGYFALGHQRTPSGGSTTSSQWSDYSGTPNVVKAQEIAGASGHQRTPSGSGSEWSDYSGTPNVVKAQEIAGASGHQRTPSISGSEWSDYSGTPNEVAAGRLGHTTGDFPDTVPSSSSKQVNCVSKLMKIYNSLSPAQKVLFYICVGLIIGSIATAIAVGVQYG